MGTDPLYNLDSQEFQQALDILQREKNANRPTDQQQKLFKLLNVLIYTFVGAYLIQIPGIFVFSSLDGYFPELVFMVFFIVTSIMIFLSSLGILILFLINIPFFKKLQSQRKMTRELGLWDVLHDPWKEKQQTRRFRGVFQRGVLTVGVVIAVVCLVFVLFIIKQNDPELTAWPVWFWLLCLFIVGIAIITTHFMRRSKERLELVSQLYSSLENYKDGVGADVENNVNIPEKDYMKIAQIERAQIARDRVKSIMEENNSSYLLQKSFAAQQAQAKMDATTRLRVQDQIDELIANPHPNMSEPNLVASAGIFYRPIPETPLVIGYSVDDESRRIRVHTIDFGKDAPVAPSMHRGE